MYYKHRISITSLSVCVCNALTSTSSYNKIDSKRVNQTLKKMRATCTPCVYELRVGI